MFKTTRIKLRYRYRIACITLNKHYKMVRLNVAGKLLKLTNKLSPELMKQYDAAVINNYYQTDRIGIKW